MTDGRTDRRTSCDGIVRAMHTRRAVKIVCSKRKGLRSSASDETARVTIRTVIAVDRLNLTVTMTTTMYILFQ